MLCQVEQCDYSDYELKDVTSHVFALLQFASVDETSYQFINKTRSVKQFFQHVDLHPNRWKVHYFYLFIHFLHFQKLIWWCCNPVRVAISLFLCTICIESPLQIASIAKTGNSKWPLVLLLFFYRGFSITYPPSDKPMHKGFL